MGDLGMACSSLRGHRSADCFGCDQHSRRQKNRLNKSQYRPINDTSRFSPFLHAAMVLGKVKQGEVRKMEKSLAIRASKIFMVFGIGCLVMLVAFNNVVDYQSNF